MNEQYAVAENALVVEDFANWRNILKALLEEENYIVRTTSSYQEAVKLLKNETFRLVTVDLSLTPGDQQDRQGLKLVQKIKEQDQYMAVICVTGFGTLTEASETVRQHKAFAFMAKRDFDPGTFKTLVRNAVECAKRRRETNELLEQLSAKTKTRRAIRRERSGD